MSDLRNAQFTFWSRYLERLHTTHPNTSKVRKPQAQNWLTLNFFRGLGITGVFASDGTLRCELYIDVGEENANIRIFNQLRDSKDEIESAIGEKLNWDSLEGRRACRVSLCTAGTPLDDDQDALIAWLIEHHLIFRRVFIPAVKGLPKNLWGKTS